MCDVVLTHSFFSDFCQCPSLILLSLSSSSSTTGRGDSDTALSLVNTVIMRAMRVNASPTMIGANLSS